MFPFSLVLVKSLVCVLYVVVCIACIHSCGFVHIYLEYVCMHAWVHMKARGQAWVSSLICSLNLRQDFPLKLASLTGEQMPRIDLYGTRLSTRVLGIELSSHFCIADT